MENHVTMQQLEDLGFEIVLNYAPDGYIIQAREKGCLRVETKWEKGGSFVSQEVTILNDYPQGFSYGEIKMLDTILNNKKQ